LIAIVVARTGGGKGLLAIPQLLTYSESVIVNDIKGDLRKHTSGWRSTFSDVLVLDPRGQGNRFDPLAGIVDESELLAIAADLLHDPRETNPVFTTRAIGNLTILFLAAIAEGYPKFPYVRQALLAGPTAIAERLQAIRPVLARRFLDRPYLEAKREHFHDTFLLHTHGTLKAKLMPILTETIVKTLPGSGILIYGRVICVLLRSDGLEIDALTFPSQFVIDRRQDWFIGHAAAFWRLAKRARSSWVIADTFAAAVPVGSVWRGV
jgi:hypothetical protein